MLTIGEFSRLAHVSARMLRHYDLTGLLRPAHTGANGYRYYDEAQLATLARIEQLKQYGFKLAEIPGLLGLAPQQLAQRLHARRLDAYSQLHQLRATLRRMESDLTEMEGPSLELEKHHVIVMDAPAQKVFSIRRTINISQMDALFEELLAEAKKRGLVRNGPTQHRYMGEDFDYDNMDVEAQVQVEGDGDGVVVLPAGTFVATTHTGPYETVKYAYEAIAAYMAAHPEYRVCGPAIERYLKDEGMVQSTDELETGILFPIEKV